MRYNKVIWDWNGTLFNDAHFCVEIINELLLKRKLPSISLEEYRRIFTFPVEKYYAKLFDLKAESFEKLGSEWMEKYESGKLKCRLAEGAKQIVEFLSSKGVMQYVLSAYSEDKLRALLAHYRLDGFMLEIKGLDNIYAHSKMELGVELIDKIKQRGDNIVMIGDTLHDAEVAGEMGIDSILIASGHQSVIKLKESGSVVLYSLSELKRFFE